MLNKVLSGNVDRHEDAGNGKVSLTLTAKSLYQRIGG